MMRTPFSPFYLLLFLLLFGSLAGSLINIPLFTIRTQTTPGYINSPLHGLLRGMVIPDSSSTIIAANVGGCVIPTLFSLYLMLSADLHLFEVTLATGIVILISYLVSRPIPGMGIGMPIFVAPITAALIAITINADNSAPLAYISGTLGVLIGADLLHLGDIPRVGAPVASIGGAGTFDGIFITGIVAVLLA